MILIWAEWGLVYILTQCPGLVNTYLPGCCRCPAVPMLMCGAAAHSGAIRWRSPKAGGSQAGCISVCVSYNAHYTLTMIYHYLKAALKAKKIIIVRIKVVVGRDTSLMLQKGTYARVVTQGLNYSDAAST